MSQKFPQRCLWNSSNVCLIDDGPLSSVQGRSSSASSFHASLLQASNGVMSLALCPQVVFRASQHFRPSEKQATCDGCFARQSVCSVLTLHSSMSRQYTHRSLQRWMLTIGTFQSGLPIPLFIFSRKLIESVRMIACVVWLSPLQAIQRRAWVTASTSLLRCPYGRLVWLEVTRTWQ